MMMMMKTLILKTHYRNNLTIHLLVVVEDRVIILEILSLVNQPLGSTITFILRNKTYINCRG